MTVDSPRAEFDEAPDAFDYPGAYTLDLARYEQSNAVLGQLRTHGTLSEDEAEELATASSFILLNMTALTVDDEPGVLPHPRHRGHPPRPRRRTRRNTHHEPGGTPLTQRKPRPSKNPL